MCFLSTEAKNIRSRRSIHICLRAFPLDEIMITITIVVMMCSGEKLVNFMVEPKKGTKWPKELPRFSARPDAIAVCKELCNIQYIHRSEKVAKGELEVSFFVFEDRSFDEYLHTRPHFIESPKGLLFYRVPFGATCCLE